MQKMIKKVACMTGLGAFAVGCFPVFAEETGRSAVGNIVESMVALIIRFVAGVVGAVLDALIEPVMIITGMTFSDICGFIPGLGTGETANLIIQRMSVAVFSVLAFLHILQYLLTLMHGGKVESLGKLFYNVAFWGVLVGGGQRILRVLFDNIVVVFAQDFARVGRISSGALEQIGNAVMEDSTGVLGCILAIVLVVMIGVQAFGFSAECAERYIICIVLLLLSPLMFALGAVEEMQKVARQWVRMFFTHSMLLILNIWCVGIMQTAFERGKTISSTPQLLIWGLVTYGMIKIFQKLDDMVQASGLAAVRTGHEFVRDFAAAAGTAMAAGRMAAGAMGFTADTMGAGTRTIDAIRDKDVSRVQAELKDYARRHPIAGMPGVMAGEGMEVAKAARGRGLVNDLSENRMGSAASDANRAVRNNPYVAGAVAGKLNKSGLFEGEVHKDELENLRIDPGTGRIHGEVVKRDAEKNVLTREGFVMDREGGEQKEQVQKQFAQKVITAPDGLSAEVTDSEHGRYAIRNAGTDGKGNETWRVEQLENAEGKAIDSRDSQERTITTKAGAGAENAANTILSNRNGMSELGEENRRAEEERETRRTKAEEAEQDFRVNDENWHPSERADYNDTAHLDAAEELVRRLSGENANLEHAGRILEEGGRAEVNNFRMDDEGYIESILRRRDEDGRVVQGAAVRMGRDEQGNPSVSETGYFEVQVESDTAAVVKSNAWQELVIRRTSLENGESEWEYRGTTGNGESVLETARRKPGRGGRPITAYEAAMEAIGEDLPRHDPTESRRRTDRKKNGNQRREGQWHSFHPVETGSKPQKSSQAGQNRQQD